MKNVFTTTVFASAIICLAPGYTNEPSKYEEQHQIQFVNLGQDQTFAQQGKTYFDAGNFNGAWYCFNEAIKINPNEQFYYYMRAACSGRQGNTQAAIIDYNKALSVAKNDEQRGWIYYDLAITYAQMGDENTATAHLVTSAKCGNGLAQNFCNQYGITYS